MTTEKHKAEDRKLKTENIKVEDKKEAVSKSLKEVGGRGGLDPSRFGDWEIAGKCVDF